jgi:hypothetical protein
LVRIASRVRKLLTTQPVLRRDLMYVSKERSNQQAMKLQINPMGRAELGSLMATQVSGWLATTTTAP